MSNKRKFKVGDKIVDHGQIYRIFKVKKVKGFNDKKGKHLFYKQYFKREKDQSLICSIPESNVNKANLRRPASKKKIRETLRLLKKKPNGETKVSVADAAAFFKENDPREIARLLRLLWVEKQDKDKPFATRKKIIFKNAMRYLTEEISLVQKIGLKKARQKIRRRLKRIHPVKQKEENK
jgi:RNA polymerase-interacting CarD/CdnL/TRCF family regulator